MELYLIRLGQTQLYKIGISKNAKKRIKQLQTGCPHILSIENIYTSEKAFKIENVLHNTFSHKKAGPDFEYDFVLLSGEWFALNIDDVIDFKITCEKIEHRLNHLKEAGNPFV